MAALSEVRLDCGWAPYEIADAHDESLDVVNVALADQFEGPGAVQVISQGLVAVSTHSTHVYVYWACSRLPPPLRNVEVRLGSCR